MFVNNQRYDTNLVDINTIRYLLFRELYNPNHIELLKSIISKYIVASNIDFDADHYRFIIKIKKIAMRKLNPSFKLHKPSSYYDTISCIFNEFIQNNRNIIIEGLASKDIKNPSEVLDSVLANQSILANLCQIVCINDNILIINL